MPVALPSIPLAPADRPLILLPVRVETRFFQLLAGVATPSRFASIPTPSTLIRMKPELLPAKPNGVATTGEPCGALPPMWNAEELPGGNWPSVMSRSAPPGLHGICGRSTPETARRAPSVLTMRSTPSRASPSLRNCASRPNLGRALRGAAYSRTAGSPSAMRTATRSLSCRVAQSQIRWRSVLLPQRRSQPAMISRRSPPARGGWWTSMRRYVSAWGLNSHSRRPPPRSTVCWYSAPRGRSNSDASAERLEELINAHGYTQGFSFLPPGTPSNNTAEAPSGFSSFDPGYESSFQADQASEDPSDSSNGGLAAKAFGIPASTFARIERSRADDMSDGRHMNTALWEGTWGYFLSQMVNDALPQQGVDTVIAWVRRHFVEHVRAGGPFPAIRCGRQPYGLLPVSSIDLMAIRPEDGTDVQRTRELLSVVAKLSRVWMRASAYAPRMGRSADPRQDLLEVLRLQASSNKYAIRAALGRHYFQNLWQFQLIDLGGSGWRTRLEQIVNASL